jgi:glycosyltransferase involved in cell wall biosynthesis
MLRTRMTGAGRYVFELARRLPRLGIDLHMLIPNDVWHTHAAGVLHDAGVLLHTEESAPVSLRQYLSLPIHIQRLKPDLLHYPFLNLPFVGCPAVVTIYDLNPLTQPDYFKGFRLAKRLGAQAVIKSTLDRCRMALAISDATRDSISTHFPRVAGKLRTVPLGIDSNWLSAASRTPREDGANAMWWSRPYALYVGVDRPHKNLVRLVRGFDLFRKRFPPGPRPYLWLAGVGEATAALRVELSTLGLVQDVRLTGELSETDLATTYAFAHLVVYVSLSEGFGLPILEAFASGVPVVASAVPALMEVAGGAALLVDPLDIAEVAEGIRVAWTDDDLRRRLIALGASRADEFSWESTAALTVQAYEAAVFRGIANGMDETAQ